MMKKLIPLILSLVLALTVSPAFAQSFSFDSVKDMVWTFSSGVGAWFTQLTIHEDGTFTGTFRDSDMGDVGEGYPDGTTYVCSFHGSFTQPEQLDDLAWKFKVAELVADEGQEAEKIEDGVRYVTASPYGLAAGHEVVLYLPGYPVEKLDEEAPFWFHLYDEGEGLPATLPCYGLEDMTDLYGFVGEAA